MAGHYAPECEHVQCLALSPDGINWERPSLGIHEALGSKDNNIVIPATHHEGQDHWETMLKDPLDPDPARRYKAIGWSSYDWDGARARAFTAPLRRTGSTGRIRRTPIFRYHPRPGHRRLGAGRGRAVHDGGY